MKVAQGNIKHRTLNAEVTRVEAPFDVGRSMFIQSSCSGFTLIEVVISSALMSLILLSAYICFNAAIGGRKTMEPRLEVIQNARVAMALVTADLRNACPLDDQSQFLGMRRMLGDVAADNIDFATHNYTPQRSREGDFCQVSYYLDRDAATGQLSLYRRRNPTIAPDSLSGGSKEEIATGIKGLQFEYSDGVDWYDTWGDVSARGKKQTSQKVQPNLSGMPEAVRITLWFDANPHKKTEAELNDQDETPAAPVVFQTVARLNVRSSQPNSSDGASGATTPDAGGQSAAQGNMGGMVQ